jgi:hypothetical protein
MAATVDYSHLDTWARNIVAESEAWAAGREEGRSRIVNRGSRRPGEEVAAGALVGLGSRRRRGGIVGLG